MCSVSLSPSLSLPLFFLARKHGDCTPCLGIGFERPTGLPAKPPHTNM